MKILGLRENPSFLQEDAEWSYEDVQNSLEKVNMLTFPFEAKFPHDKNGEINVDWNNCPQIIDPFGNVWSMSHFRIGL